MPQTYWLAEGVSVGDGDEVANSIADRLIKAQGYGLKIDGQAVDGLAGVSNSLAYRVHEIEKHLHNTERWFGRDAGDTFFAENGLLPWTLIAGNGGVFGDWVQLSNGDEIIAPAVKYDPHEILVITTSVASKLYYIQLGTGAGGAQVVITTAPIYPAASVRQTAMPIISPRVGIAEKLWARCNCETNAATVTMVLGLHTYTG